MPAPSSRSSRKAFTLVEVLFAAALTSVVIGGVLVFLNTGSRSVVISTDHSMARDHALTLFQNFAEDLDRIVVSDAYQGSNTDLQAVLEKDLFPSVLQPILIDSKPRGSKFTFYAFHHRDFDPATKKMKLVAQRVEYRVVPRGPDPLDGVDLFRHDSDDVPLNTMPLYDVHFRTIEADEAERLSISKDHAVRIEIYPLGTWVNKQKLLRLPPDLQREALTKLDRLFHLKGVESQFAVLLSLRAAGAPYPQLFDARLSKYALDRLPFYSQYNLHKVPLDWLRPTGLVEIDPQDFDDSTMDNPGQSFDSEEETE